MSFRNWIISKFGKKKKGFALRRSTVFRAGYSGAETSRILADMVVGPVSADTDLRWALRILRARCRDLAINNDYVKKFLWMVASNVVGPKGIMLQSKMKGIDDSLDKDNNKAIEDAFLLWGKKKNCTVTGMNSWPSFQRQVIQTVARDGEIFIRKVKGFKNDFGFALQALEADYVDENYNDRERNIRMGIEYDAWRRPVAYHFLQSNIYDYQSNYSRIYQRLPASDVIHLFIQERPEQGRGAPWICTPMARLNILGGYEEAELVASRGAAAKMGFYKPDSGNPYVGDDEDKKQNPVMEVEPGIFETLERGMDFIPYDPQHPTTAYGDFVKSCLRGISSGLLVSYNSLANDLEGVNYSSIRQGVIDERDIWRILQEWFIEHFHEDVFQDWREMAILAGKIKSLFAATGESNLIRWQPRGWAWVDPEKDQNANIIGIGAGLNTRTRSLAEEGYDVEDIFDELAEEEKLAKEKGLKLSVQPGTKVVPQQEEAPARRTPGPMWNKYDILSSEVEER